MSRHVFLLLMCGVLYVLCPVPCGYADSSTAAKPGDRETDPSMNVCRKVSVTIRTIRGSGQQETSVPQQVRIDQRLSNLKDRLTKLPFSSYDLVHEERLIVGLKKKTALSLPEGKQLLLRTLYVNDEQVGLWLRWQEEDGTEIIDTRLHLQPGHSVIAGTEHDGDPRNGLLLAVEIEPKRDHQSSPAAAIH